MPSRYRVVAQTPTPPTDTKDAAALAEHRDSLYRRLEIGYERIEKGLAEGQDVTNWEDFWVALLKEYERVCDELARDLAAAPTQARLGGIR